MRHFEYMLSIARGFAPLREEARESPAEAVAVRAPATDLRDAATDATAGKLRTQRPPPRRIAS